MSIKLKDIPDNMKGFDKWCVEQFGDYRSLVLIQKKSNGDLYIIKPYTTGGEYDSVSYVGVYKGNKVVANGHTIIEALYEYKNKVGGRFELALIGSGNKEMVEMK